MDKYQFLGELGDGTSGDVFKALNKETNEIVAVKKMKRKFYCWEECINLPEVKSLSRLKHPNIVKLKEVISENHELFFIFEYMECNLFHIMKGRQFPFSAAEIRNVMFQVLQGLAYMHNNGYFHRDLKPENLLVTGDVIKIADFGLAREVSSRPPYTDYVSTRWYRAPEVLLQSSTYTPAIDMWAVGAIIAELFTLCPLFPGQSETDQVYKICAILGTPNYTTWADGMKLSLSLNFSFFEMAPVNLAEVIPQASIEALDLITRLCSWDPQKRPTAEQSLRHPFFHVNVLRPPPTYHAYQPLPDHRPKLELNLWDFDTDRNDCFLKLDRNDCFLGLTLGLKPSPSDLELNAPFRRLSESGFLDINRMDVNYEHYPAMTSGYLPPMNLNQESGLLVASSSMPSLYFFKSPVLPPEEKDPPVPTELKLALQSMWDWPCV